MKKINEKETTPSVKKKSEDHTLDKVLQIELRCSEAVGIRKNEPSGYLNDSWQRATKQNFSNLYNTPTTTFKTFGNSSTIGQLSGLAKNSLRTGFLGSGDELPLIYTDSQIASPFVIHWFVTNGKLISTPNFFQLAARTPQQSVDFTLIARYLAEKSLCPALVVHDLAEVEEGKIELPDLKRMFSVLGLPDDQIETPTSFQKEIFGDKRRRIPDVSQFHFADGNVRLLRDVPALFTNALSKFAKLTGSSYNIVDQVKTNEADIIVVAAGRNFYWLSKNLSKLNKNLDSKIGLIHPNLISPFPGGIISNILKGKRQAIAVSNNDNSDHDPVIRGIRAGFDKAIENALVAKKTDMPYPDHAVFSNISDRPQLITFSTHGNEIDFKRFQEALKNIEQGASSIWHVNVTAETNGKKEKSPRPKIPDVQAESKERKKITIKEEAVTEVEVEVSSGDNFRQLLSFFVTGKAPHPEMEQHVGLNLKPVFLSTTENSQYNNFPICLIDDSTENFVKPLPKIFNEIVSEEAEGENAGADLKEDLSALESRMELLVNGKKTGRLTELWDMATESILADIQEDEEKREAVQKNLQKGKEKLQVDGEVLSLNTGFPQRVIEESLTTAWSKKISPFRDELNRLISQLYDLLGIDPSKESDKNDSEDFGSSVASAFRDELDFESFSQLVEESFERQPLPKNRRSRIQGVIKSLKALQPFYSLAIPADRDEESILSPFQFYCDSKNCSVTIGQIQARIRTIAKFFRALHIAKLEVQNKYKEEKHERFFNEYTINHLTADDLELVPLILLYVNLKSMNDSNLAAIMDLLSSDLPIKIILQNDDVIDKCDLLPDQLTWSTKFACIAIAFNNVYVFQSAAADGEQFANGILQGFNYNGPALFNICTAAEENFTFISLKQISAAAMETRAFPTLVYDPLKSADWGSRFSISDNPQFEKDWVTHELTYQDADGKDTSIELAFTLVDFLGADKRFADHFLRVPRNRWHESMIPLQDYLKLKQDEAKYKLPYIFMTGEKGTLHRVIPTRFVVGLAFSWLQVWRSLQELGLYEEEKERLEEKRKTEIEGVEEKYKKEQAKSEKELKQEVISNLLTRLLGGDIKAPKEVATPPAGGEEVAVEAAEAVERPAEEEEKEEVAEIVEPYIDTPLCTTCNECTNLNSRMFAYNENKQAYIKDAKAGTFKELVKAAEKCPARIIHPGKPKNSNEPGLEKLIKRAEPFNK